MTYPTIRPELTLDFANSRQLDPRIAFSRSSSATYLNPDTGLITLASDHEARFEKEGLLIEESRTNEFPYSEDFSYNSWTKVNTTVTTNAATAPDGTSTANRLQIGATNGVIYDNAVQGVASNSTISMWVKAVNPGTDDVFRLASAGDLTADLTATNEWVRYTFTSSTNTSSLHGIARPSDNTAADVYVWGAQFEEGKTFPTSYIPTAGSTITRSSDIAQITGDNFSSWYKQGEGTYVAKFRSQYPDGEDTTVMQNGSRIFAFVNLNRVHFKYGATSVYSNNSTSGYPAASEFSTAAMFYTDDGTNHTVGGSFQGFPAVSTSGTGSVTNTELKFAPFTGASGALQSSTAHLSRLAYYSRRLTDLELETLTL